VPGGGVAPGGFDLEQGVGEAADLLGVYRSCVEVGSKLASHPRPGAHTIEVQLLGEVLMITKALVSAVIALGVGVAVAAPATADPYVCRPIPEEWFTVPFCISQSAPGKAGPAVPNQNSAGNQNGHSDLPATQGQP
jgi:hypothetical protein